MIFNKFVQFFQINNRSKFSILFFFIRKMFEINSLSSCWDFSIAPMLSIFSTSSSINAHSVLLKFGVFGIQFWTGSCSNSILYPEIVSNIQSSSVICFHLSTKFFRLPALNLVTCNCSNLCADFFCLLIPEQNSCSGLYNWTVLFCISLSGRNWIEGLPLSSCHDFLKSFLRNNFYLFFVHHLCL